MRGPVTSDPLLIAIINMTIVFGVLGALGVLIEIIHQMDPTKAPKVAPVTVAAPVAEVEEEVVEDDTEVVAVITAAVVAMGYSSDQIAYIGRLEQKSWAANSRVEAVSTRNQMYM